MSTSRASSTVVDSTCFQCEGKDSNGDPFPGPPCATLGVPAVKGANQKTEGSHGRTPSGSRMTEAEAGGNPSGSRMTEAGTSIFDGSRIIEVDGE